MTCIRKILPLVLLLALCLGMCAALASCGTAANEAKYDKATAKEAVAALRTYLRETKGVGKSLVMLKENEAVQVYTYLQKASVTGVAEGEEPLYLSVITFSADGRYSYRLDLVLDSVNPDNALRRFKYSDRTLGYTILQVEDTLRLPSYTGAGLMSFENMEYPTPETDAEGNTPETADPVPATEFLRETARDMLNLMVITLDAFMEKAIGHDRDDFGFVSYNEKYNPKNNTPTASLPQGFGGSVGTLAKGNHSPAFALLTADGLTSAETEVDSTAETVAETEDPLGPMFSSDRWGYVARMTAVGMGMVFAVLAILWGILSIFKLAFVGKTPKESKPKVAPAPAPTAPAAAPVAPPPAAIPEGTDPAVVAAITAAIAEMIAADPALTARFAGGFRVVEFKRKSGKTSWNH